MSQTVVARPDLAGALLERAGCGDVAAFGEFYDLMAHRVHGLALRVVRAPALAVEVAQETWIDVWRTAARFDPSRGSAQGWVLTTTHRRAVDHLRTVDAMSRRETTYHRQQGATDYDVTQGAVLDHLDADRVRAALAELTDLQREALTLAYFDGRTHTEVAARLGLPLGTAKTRIRDGLLRLRVLLQEQ